MKTLIKIFSTLAAILLLAPIFTTGAAAGGGIVVDPNGAKLFATMPAGFNRPEGITVNPTNGEVIVGTYFGAVQSRAVFEHRRADCGDNNSGRGGFAGYRLQSG